MRHFAAHRTVSTVALTLTATTLAAALSLGADTRLASAATPVDENYRDAMRVFVRDLSKWGAGLQESADAAVIKPELGCSAEMIEQVTSGQWMVDDLAGTARLAPAHLAYVHGMLIDSVSALSAEAGGACYDPAAAAEAIRAERVGFDWAIAQIAFHAKHGGGGK
jgi:hypothetical protein